MAFADPQSVTINAVPMTLPRVSSERDAGSFRKDDGTVAMKVSHTYGKRVRHLIQLDHQKYAADPLVSSTNVLRTMKCYMVVDVPLQGYTVTEQKQIVDALTAYLTASTGARTTQLLGGEN